MFLFHFSSMRTTQCRPEAICTNAHFVEQVAIIRMLVGITIAFTYHPHPSVVPEIVALLQTMQTDLPWAPLDWFDNTMSYLPLPPQVTRCPLSIIMFTRGGRLTPVLVKKQIGLNYVCVAASRQLSRSCTVRRSLCGHFRLSRKQVSHPTCPHWTGQEV
jgi:hypothetical protein